MAAHGTNTRASVQEGCRLARPSPIACAEPFASAGPRQGPRRACRAACIFVCIFGMISLRTAAAARTREVAAGSAGAGAGGQWFVAAPAYMETGGPEALHQLCMALNAVGQHASMLYFGPMDRLDTHTHTHTHTGYWS